MSDRLHGFLSSCQEGNARAARANYPLLAAPFRSETPLNSAPYVMSIDGFRRTFAYNRHRRLIVEDWEAALAKLGELGIVWQVILIGGSFIRAGDSPSDLDGLVVYTADPMRPEGVDAGLAAYARTTRQSRVDFKFCPADVHPALLIKRLSFFTSLFGYDRSSGAIVHGTIMVLPDAIPSAQDGPTAHSLGVVATDGTT